MNDSPSLFLIKVDDFLSEILCSLWFYMSLPSARIGKGDKGFRPLESSIL